MEEPQTWDPQSSLNYHQGPPALRGGRAGTDNFFKIINSISL